jgi:hypothetical protein
MISFDEIPMWLYATVAGAVIFALLLYVFVLMYLRSRTRRRNEQCIESIAYEVLRNILIPNGNGGQIHLNYLLLTERGLMVVDLFDVPGSVFAGDQMQQWTSIGRKRRYQFSNPQSLLYDRMAAVKLLAGMVPVDGCLIFTTRSEFPKGKPKYVARIDELGNYFPIVDRSRGYVAGAFNDVWRNVKAHAQPNLRE